jgi:hypothetical protein
MRGESGEGGLVGVQNLLQHVELGSGEMIKSNTRKVVQKRPVVAGHYRGDEE